MFCLVLSLILLHVFVDARMTHSRRDTLPLRPRKIAGGIEIPFTRRGVTGSIGLGDNSDLLYTVPIELDDTTTIVHLDTGSSDLWVISDQCTTGACPSTPSPNVMQLPASNLNNSGTSVAMYYGDSTTGTYATGPIAYSSATLAGVAIENQAFAAVNATTNSIVRYGTAGIFGLGFPSGSSVQQSLSVYQHGAQSTTDAFVSSTYKNGPLLSRIVQTNALDNPMFTISLQRNTIDPGSGGTGLLTIGALPEGVDNSSITWVPVRLYSHKEGGLKPPTFAPDEIYPYRWEIVIDGVYIDGTKLPPSSIPVLGGVNSSKTSALIDTGNSLLRGPSDTISRILQTVATDPNASPPTLPCKTPHTLGFEIAGKMFTVDPRDFISENPTPNLSADVTEDNILCVASNIVATDPPNVGTLFRWSLGDPFLKSNLVAFHYGNLTHPSVDPPRIGLMSVVPADANALLEDAVEEAVSNDGDFESTLQIAPTASAAQEDQTTVVPVSVNFAQSTSTPTSSTNPQLTLATSTSTSTSIAGNGATSMSVSMGVRIVLGLSIALLLS